MSPALKSDTDAIQGEGAFGVYVHWPFCAAKCPYCDFNSHVRHAGVEQRDYLAAFEREIAHTAGTAPKRTVTSIFFGGGTPSLMDPEIVDGILRCIESHWKLEDGAEITLEANPTSVDASRFAGYRAAGVNRVSLGIQSFDDKRLKFLGRMHSAEEAKKAIETATGVFERYSLDLIYATPGQQLADWKHELNQALSIAGGHLSLYQLTFEAGTPFDDLRSAGKIIPASEEIASDLFELTQEVTDANGYRAYEVSNHAQKGEECQHNLIYWRGGEFAGIGPGAHGRLQTEEGRIATETEKIPETWFNQVEKLGHGYSSSSIVSNQEQAEEYLLMGMRLAEGLDLTRYESISGKRLPADTIDHLVLLGMLELPDERMLKATTRGRLVLNKIISELATGAE